jgi:hypothetical protein
MRDLGAAGIAAMVLGKADEQGCFPMSGHFFCNSAREIGFVTLQIRCSIIKIELLYNII